MATSSITHDFILSPEASWQDAQEEKKHPRPQPGWHDVTTDEEFDRLMSNWERHHAD